MHMVSTDTDTRAQRRAFYERISSSNLTPLWEVLSALVPKSPKSLAAASLWRYADIRETVLETGRLITAAEAERRVLILENPALRGNSSITQSMYAGLQLILPGEVAPAHRHSQSALRLLLDGEGAYTTVDGERIMMHRGDFIITPSWTWHEHGNVGNEPVLWLDGLDIPVVRFLEAGFAESGENVSQLATKPEGDALARYGSNMLPVDFHQASWEPTRVFVYPYAATRATLMAIAQGPIDPHFGHKMRFVNPATGASPMPTIGAFAQYLPAGSATLPYQSTDGTVYTCLEGEGTVDISGEQFAFAVNDVFVVPSWSVLTLQASADTILFSYSDRPIQQGLGLWRERKH